MQKNIVVAYRRFGTVYYAQILGSGSPRKN